MAIDNWTSGRFGRRMGAGVMKRIVALLVVGCLFLALPACNMIEIDQEMDLAESVADFKGGSVTKGEVKSMFDLYMSYYGMDAKKNKDSAISLAESIIESVVDEKIAELKIEELDIKLTSEEEAEMRKEAQEAYQADFESRVESALADNPDEKTEEDIRAEIEQEMKDAGEDVDSVMEKDTPSKLHEKLSEYIVKDVTVGETEVKAAYDELVATQQSSYDANNSQFESDYMNDSMVLYYPADYIFVKHILVGKMTSDEESEVTILRNQAYDESGNVVDEEKRTEADELALSYIDAKRVEAEAVLERLEAGEDFDALVEELGGDPGMQREPMKTKGYVVNSDNNSGFVEPYIEAAMTLTEDGQTSDLVRTTLGWFVIRRVGSVTKGDTVSFDDVKETLTEDTLSEKKDEVTTETRANWRDSMNLKMYADKLLN